MIWQTIRAFSKAKQYILANPTKLQQWDTKDYKMPGGNANDLKLSNAFHRSCYVKQKNKRVSCTRGYPLGCS